jgi:hypothetical protein
VTYEERQQVKAARDANQRRRLVRANMTATKADREAARQRALYHETPLTAEHVPTLTESGLAALPPLSDRAPHREGVESPQDSAIPHRGPKRRG